MAGGRTAGAEEVLGVECTRRHYVVSSLVKLSADGCKYHVDDLTIWDKECRLQFEAMGSPMDAYSLRVADVRQRAVHAPLALSFTSAQEGLWDSTVFLPPHAPLRQPSWPNGEWHLMAGEPPTCADEVLRSWGIGTPADKIYMLILPFPITYLVGH